MTSQGELTKEEKEALGDLDFLLAYRFRWLWCPYHDGCAPTPHVCSCERQRSISCENGFVFVPEGRNMRRVIDEYFRDSYPREDKTWHWYARYLHTRGHEQKRAIEEEIYSYLDSIGL